MHIIHRANEHTFEDQKFVMVSNLNLKVTHQISFCVLIFCEHRWTLLKIVKGEPIFCKHKYNYS